MPFRLGEKTRARRKRVTMKMMRVPRKKMGEILWGLPILHMLSWSLMSNSPLRVDPQYCRDSPYSLVLVANLHFNHLFCRYASFQGTNAKIGNLHPSGKKDLHPLPPPITRDNPSHPSRRCLWLKKSGVGTSTNPTSIEASTLSSEVLVANPSPFENITRDPPSVSSSWKGEASSSHSSFSYYLQCIEEESYQPFVPYPKDRWKLKVKEELPGYPPIHPLIVNPRLTLVPILGYGWPRGDHFQLYPELIDTDFLKDLGVGSLLIYASMLP